MTASRKKSSARSGLAGIVCKAFKNARRSEPGGAGYYLKLGRTSMACQFEVFLRPEDRSFINAAQEAFEEIERLEQQLSVYRPDSEISTLNRCAARAPVRVEAELYELFRLARNIGAETGGALDLTAGALIRCWGLLERKGRMPHPKELAAARAVTGWDCVEFDDASHSVFFRRTGVELNLGSIGKGYALDRAAAILRKSGLRDFMIHAGHSSILASGDSNRGPAWEVSLRNPNGKEGGYGTLCLLDQGLSTSGAGEQFFLADNRRFGHILDPRTGCPATQNLMASVVARDATLAEALSTAFFIMDPREILAYCAKNEEVGVIICTLCEGDSEGDSPPTLVHRVALMTREEDPI